MVRQAMWFLSVRRLCSSKLDNVSDVLLPLLYGVLVIYFYITNHLKIYTLKTADLYFLISMGQELGGRLVRWFWFRTIQDLTGATGIRGLPWWLSGNKSTCNAGARGDSGLIPGLGRSPGGGRGNPLQYPCLENPIDRRACWAIVHKVTKSWTQLKQLSTHRDHKA